MQEMGGLHCMKTLHVMGCGNVKENIRDDSCLPACKKENHHLASVGVYKVDMEKSSKVGQEQKYLCYNVYRKVNKCSHFNSGPSSGIGRISENGAVCPLEIRSRPPRTVCSIVYTVYILGLAVSSFPQGCIALTPSPMFLPESSEW